MENKFLVEQPLFFCEVFWKVKGLVLDRKGIPSFFFFIYICEKAILFTLAGGRAFRNIALRGIYSMIKANVSGI